MASDQFGLHGHYVMYYGVWDLEKMGERQFQETHVCVLGGQEPQGEPGRRDLGVRSCVGSRGDMCWVTGKPKPWVRA